MKQSGDTITFRNIIILSLNLHDSLLKIKKT